MSEIDKNKPEAPKLSPKSHEGTAHTLSVFAQSLAYSALEAPSRGVAQLVDHTFTTHLDETVQKKFGNAGVHKPDETTFGTKDWTAQQFGAAIGATLPMKLSRMSMFGAAEKELFAASKFEAGVQRASLIDKAMTEARISTRTGLVYGAIFTPTENNAENSRDHNFLTDRLMQGLKTGTVFGATGYASGLTGAAFDRAANGLETTAANGAFKTSLQTALHSNLVRGAIGGVPGGIVQAQIGAMQDGRWLATAQEIKENIASQSMVGGAMGAAKLFKDSSQKADNKKGFSLDFSRIPQALTDNLVALKNDSLLNAKHLTFASTIIEQAPTPKPVEIAKPANTAHPFDIKFDPGQNAWEQAKVDQYKTSETRPIDFAKAGREAKAATADWSKFNQWGVESRQMPVDVYRFPGLKTEIVVPSEYARVLDQLRDHRLNGTTPNIEGSPLAGRYQRVLPEEMAQMLTQLPDPDIVKTVELLDHASPKDMLRTKEKIDELKAKGENPPPNYKLYSLADATIDGSGRMRIYESQTNHPIKFQETAAHEWAHIAETHPAFAAFGSAQIADGKRFYARPYAEENIHEDVAVHLGERVLNPKGSSFAEIPERAPARTIVMATALRQMLEARSDNPTPRHAEFMARAKEAENVATTNLQISMLADIAGGNHEGLDQKLRFIDTAAVASSSHDMHDKILGPIHNDLIQSLATRAPDDHIANRVYARQVASELASNQTPALATEFANRWKLIDDSGVQAHLFKSLPENAQNAVLTELRSSPIGYDRNDLIRLRNATEGATQERVKGALIQAQLKFENDGMELDRANKPIPAEYVPWLKWSNNPDARSTALKYEKLQTADQFLEYQRGLPPASVRQFVAGGAMAYVEPGARQAAWEGVLKTLPQAEQAKLFRDFSHNSKGAFADLALKIEKMTPVQFTANSKLIHAKSLALLDHYEQTPEFVISHPRAIRDANKFLNSTRALDNRQIADLIRDGALDGMPTSERSATLNGMMRRAGLREQLDLLGAIKPSVNSKERIDVLSELTDNRDPVVAAKSRRLLIDIAEAQLGELKANSKLRPGQEFKTSEERQQNHNDYLAARRLENKMISFEDARARLAYLKASEPDANGNLKLEKFAVATSGLPDDQIIKFLKSGIVDRLPAAERTPFLRQVSAARSEEVKTLALFMELHSLRGRG